MDWSMPIMSWFDYRKREWGKKKTKQNRLPKEWNLFLGETNGKPSLLMLNSIYEKNKRFLGFPKCCCFYSHLLLYTQSWPGHLVDMKKRTGGLFRNRHKSLKTVSQTWGRACCVRIRSLWTQIRLVSSYLEKKLK